MSERHVTNGDAAAGGLLSGLGCERSSILVSRDILSCGPLPPLDDLDDWRRRREHFCWELVADGDIASPEFTPAAEAPRELWANLPAFAAADPVTVWLGQALSDQLMLALLVQLADRAGGDPGRLRVIQFGGVVGVGALGATEIAAHPPARALGPADLAALRGAWEAVTAPEPEPLLAFLASAPSPLRPALLRLLQRYPDAQTGLSRWDAELLAHVEPHGTDVQTVVARTLADNRDELDCVGDRYLVWRLGRLADPRRPLPLLALDRPLAAGRRNGVVRLTSPGLDVRAHRRNAVDLDGIDDWVCGVHLRSSEGRCWFRRGETLTRG